MWVYLKSRNLLCMINIIFTCPHVIADGETLEHYVADVADLCQVLLCVTYTVLTDRDHTGCVDKW